MHNSSLLKFSIIIPAYNESAWLYACFEAIIKNDMLPDEIIIVNNASTDWTQEVIEKCCKLFPKVVPLHESRQGVNFARDAGWRAATGDIVWFIDADTLVPRHWVWEVIRAFHETPELGYVTWPTIQTDAPIPVLLVNIFCFPLYHILSWLFRVPLGTGWNCALRRTTLEAMNWFNTDIIFYGDDIDIALRASRIAEIRRISRMRSRTSARRYRGQWAWRTNGIYLLNIVWIRIWRRPFCPWHVASFR